MVELGRYALFLLPVNLEKLKPKFEQLRPGTRIVTVAAPTYI